MHAAMLVDSLWVLLTRLVMRAANFAVFLLLARSLGVAEFGFYGYVMSTALVLAVAFDLGLRQSGAWLIGQEPESDAAVTTHLVALWLVLGALGVLVCWLMLESAGYAASYGLLALVGALNVAPMLCLRTGQGVFLGRGELGKLNRSELISRAVVLVGTVSLWATGLLDVRSAVWTLLAAHVAASLYLLVQIGGGIRPKTLFQPRLVARMLRYGGELWVAMLLLILLGRIGFWVVSWQLGEQALGLYFGSQRLGEILVEVATAVGIVIFSYGVRAKDIRASALDAIRIARLVTALMALVALAAMVAARPLLGLALGPEYAAEPDAFRLVMLGALASSYTTMLYPCLSSQGLARFGILAFGLGSAVAALAFAGLTPLFGLAGAGLAYALAQSCAVAVIAYAYRCRFGFPIVAVVLPQAEDARMLRDIAWTALGRLRRARP
ncbi:lipopolysaccharide biosynthesis protein [Benzoatithermus flavus]|uniref:Oligosaccharide flippase family protein n=1 Tax=Benzoatithermus flavus TaxID=3108223 RepID=A0ABU8XR55_9PROT